MRTADKQLSVVAELRTKIVQGVFPPGGKLPTRAELERYFGVSAATLQGAMDHLSRDRFIESKGRSGTFVVKTPPWLSTYALLMADHPSANASQFWTAILNEAYKLDKIGKTRLPVFYGFGPMHLRPDDFVDYYSIIEDVRAHRLGGLIFVTNPDYFEGTPIVSERIPSVAVKTASALGIPGVYPDMVALVEQSLDYLQALGRRRVAVAGLDLSFTGRYTPQRLQAAIESRGMVTRPFWNLQLESVRPQGVQACANLLMHCTERPDAIVIADDNLVPNFTAGLLASGVRIPDDLEIVAHANFPWPTQSMAPARRIGFDIHRLLEMCIEILAAQRDGKPVPELTLLPPLMQDE